MVVYYTWGTSQSSRHSGKVCSSDASSSPSSLRDQACAVPLTSYTLPSLYLPSPWSSSVSQLQRRPCTQLLAGASCLRVLTCWFKDPNSCLNGNNNHLKQSNHRCCAERNLLNSWVVKAHKQNVPRHQVVRWVRRKAGAQLTVWRQLADGSLGVSVPCVVCRNVLERFDLRVTCLVAPGQWFCGHVTDRDAPAAKLTSAQERILKGRK